MYPQYISSRDKPMYKDIFGRELYDLTLAIVPDHTIQIDLCVTNYLSREDIYKDREALLVYLNEELDKIRVRVLMRGLEHAIEVPAADEHSPEIVWAQRARRLIAWVFVYDANAVRKWYKAACLRENKAKSVAS